MDAERLRPLYARRGELVVKSFREGLTQAEREERRAIEEELDADEMEQMRPAFERMEAEIKRSEEDLAEVRGLMAELGLTGEGS